MTWTYVAANLATSDLFKVRFLIQDTVTTDQQFSDEEINYALSVYTDPFGTAVSLVTQLIAKYARKADKTVGDLSISYSQISKQYESLLEELQAQGARVGGALPYSGGISVSDKQTVEANTDRVAPAFRRDQFDNPETGADSTSDNTSTLP